jgi:malonate-semialdehyde dehydrogenase (acetylating)/methylmalonate-semialdehyde dehydrogenase
MQKVIPHFINGNLVYIHAKTPPSIIMNPALGTPIAELYFADAAMIQQAIFGAKSAFKSWAALPVVKRARILFKFKQLLEEKLLDLAEIITAEHGKTLDDAKGEMLRGIEIIEFACGIPHLLKGSFSDNVGTNVDSYTMRQPLGVCVGFTPFNFPAMVPMWMFPIAIACGNCFILKPSEKVPSLSVKLAELFSQAGLPPGVLQVIHGDKTVVDCLLESPDVQAVSFVGSTQVAKYIYATSAKYGKRVQALGGAKNHGIVMPDAELSSAVNSIKGAAFGAAGQRCMSISVVIAVGDYIADMLIAELRETLQDIRIGNGAKDDIDMGPIQNAAHRDNILAMIEKGLTAGAKLVVDGRDFAITKKSKGFFLGPSVFDYVTSDMEIYQQEIFGPVLCIMRAPDLNAALKIINDNAYGNGAAIYTQSGAVAHKFAANVQAGMVGINVPIPVPMAFYSFGGWKQSMFGHANMYGQEGVNFYTKLKTVTARWPEVQQYAEYEMPVSN